MPARTGGEMEEAIVFLDRHGRYVTANTAALNLLDVPDHELASFRVARGYDERLRRLADWGILTQRGAGIGESLLVSPGGRRFEVTVLVTHIATGWQITIEPLDRPAREPGVMRRSPEVLAAWRGAERRLANGDEPDIARDVDRLRHQYGQLTAHLAAKPDEGADAWPGAKAPPANARENEAASAET